LKQTRSRTAPTGKFYKADPGSAEIVTKNHVNTGEFREIGIRRVATHLLAERLRITERLR
jgi:hypothetical protein